MPAPLMVELFAGLFGWSAGARAEGWRVVGFDIVDMCKEIGEPKPDGDIQLVLQDVRTLHGSQLKDAALIVASPPCQRYSYMAMPWTRAKAQAAEIRADISGDKLIKLNELFDTCFRLQREACEAAGRYIPMVVENVKGAQPWVGRARWSFGSYFLWGDVPALMPLVKKAAKVPGLNWSGSDKPGYVALAFNDTAKERLRKQLSNRTEAAKVNLSGRAWFADGLGSVASASASRKAASAQIAKIPEALSVHIARVFKPR